MATLTRADVAEEFHSQLSGDYPMVSLAMVEGHVQSWLDQKAPKGFMEKLIHDNLGKLKANGVKVVA